MLDNNAGLQIRRVGMYHVYLAESKYSDLPIIMTFIFTNGKVYHGYFTVRICLKVLEEPVLTALVLQSHQHVSQMERF
jgi:hypothetical protein